ncbi:hypothetical protein PENSUB_3485 [Penicillium subrubescens]|uniref:Uncharacterized protein n=1 Tax=Penicillium subrubescens TaxID=1316194 RepID=A0A1Q5UF61_9EURO|nr:hypothetical protein PENSUB_3485 [Penicillium subrubescens]
MQVWSIDSEKQIGTQQQQRSSSISIYSPSAHLPLTRRPKSISPSNQSVGEVRNPQNCDTVVLAPEKLLASPTTLKTAADAFRTVMDLEQFSVIHTPFMLGPSFVPEAQKTVYTILYFSAPTLTEGYLAFLGLMTRYQRSLVMRQDEPDMSKAAKGLQRLRSVKINQDYDAACALFLGQTMQLADIERSILEWNPPNPPELLEKHGQSEVLAMMTQASAYRLAALLIIHRLRYPLGVEEKTARDLANRIFSIMTHFAQTAAEKTTALPVVFPLTIAMFEVEGPGEELWTVFSPFAVQSISAARLHGFIKQVRASKESGYEGIWFDLIETQLHVAMPP